MQHAFFRAVPLETLIPRGLIFIGPTDSCAVNISMPSFSIYVFDAML